MTEHTNRMGLNDMSDWQAGDIALCVIGGKMPYSKGISVKEFPKGGALYKVVKAGEISMDFSLKKALWFEDAPPNLGEERVWAAFRFVKVTPPEADEFDKEVIELYNKKEKPADAEPQRIATPV